MLKNQPDIDLSIVATLYYSASYLEEFYRRVAAAAKCQTDRYEIILVDDGSPDDSLEIALALCRSDARVKVVELSRNFGHHKAIMTGLSHAKGEWVFLIDCDLEEAPELLTEFEQIARQRAADVVYGVQKTRKGSFLERHNGSLYYWLFDRLSGYPVPRNQVTARLMCRTYVEALVAHRDQEIFLAGLWAITGFRQIAVPVDKMCKGQSTYTFRKKIAILVNSITAFSNAPLNFIFYLGGAILLVSGSAALWLIARRLFFGTLLEGWLSLIVSIWVLGGLTIFCLGIIGIYLSKIFTETKNRPYTIIRKIHTKPQQEPQDEL